MDLAARKQVLVVAVLAAVSSLGATVLLTPCRAGEFKNESADPASSESGDSVDDPGTAVPGVATAENHESLDESSDAPVREAKYTQPALPIPIEPRARTRVRSPRAAERRFGLPRLEDRSLSFLREGRGVYTGGLVSFVLPFILGDGGFACGSLQFTGVQEAVMGHPYFGCSRLNLAENGTPLPQDRFFFGYRHFEDPLRTDLFSVPEGPDTPPGGIDNSAVLDVDRYTFGLERTFWDGRMSVEIRVPFVGQLDSDIEISHRRIAGNLVKENVPITSQDFEFGNVGLAWKMLLLERRSFCLTGGFGLSLPTGHDVQILADIDDSQFEVYDDTGTLVGTLSVNARIRALIANETVYLTPFFGFAYKPPASRFFSQGFLQLDVPLNETRATLGVAGDVGIGAFTIPIIDPLFGTFGIAREDALAWQTLMRLNMQFGYWLYRSPHARPISGIAGLLEVHWTGTLTDAARIREPVFAIPGFTLDLDLGNHANRVDVVNLNLATAVEMGKTEITPGFTIPLSCGDNKPFDWEFTVMVNRHF